MRCPFLRETHVKYCEAAPYKKMIVEAPGASGAERCSSPAHRDCPSARHAAENQSAGTHCPFLVSSLVQYCSAAAITKYIPYSESLLSRCGTANHRYCELFLGLARPFDAKAGGSASPGESGDFGALEYVEEVPVCSAVAHSPNHMWLDVNPDGSCHVGVDAFFTRVIGRVDRLSYVPARGLARPSAVISAGGVDLQMIFPRPIQVVRTNDYLRANPEKLVSHPYTLGWLFEGEIKNGPPPADSNPRHGLLRGKAVLEWMRRELERISRFVHERCTVTGFQGESLVMDGGAVRPGLLSCLDREEAFALFNEFFAFYTIWRK